MYPRYYDKVKWGHLEVFYKDGMVVDRMSKFGKTPIPFETWWEIWENGAAVTKTIVR
jgi:hypothetical protein